MEQINEMNYLKKDEIIYWIDKEFLQWRASELIGRELDEEEIARTTKFIEWGLSASAFDVIDIAIGETMSEKLENG
jgi:hypothetical protein